jgi:hypothetical protein
MSVKRDNFEEVLSSCNMHSLLSFFLDFSQENPPRILSYRIRGHAKFISHLAGAKGDEAHTFFELRRSGAHIFFSPLQLLRSGAPCKLSSDETRLLVVTTLTIQLVISAEPLKVIAQVIIPIQKLMNACISLHHVAAQNLRQCQNLRPMKEIK